MTEIEAALQRPKPSNIVDLFHLQAELNRLAGIDTYAIGRSDDVARKHAAIFDYSLALRSELGEALDCVFWKHWSAEAKAGRRWEIADAQNLVVEAIDCLFFTTALAQCAGMTDLEFSNVANEASLRRSRLRDKKLDGMRIVCRLEEIHKIISAHEVPAARVFDFLLSDLDLTIAEVIDLYYQKWVINIERLHRGGRKQIGDEHADEENRSVRIDADGAAT